MRKRQETPRQRPKGHTLTMKNKVPEGLALPSARKTKNNLWIDFLIGRTSESE